MEEIGPGVTDLKPGDRIAYGSAPAGAYAEERLIPADRLIKLPDNIDDKTAAAMMLKGLTVQYLIRQTYRVKAGETILLHAAAGGVGLILGQWAKHLGVTVIGTVGSDEKAKLAQAHGTAHTQGEHHRNRHRCIVWHRGRDCPRIGPSWPWAHPRGAPRGPPAGPG